MSKGSLVHTVGFTENFEQGEEEHTGHNIEELFYSEVNTRFFPRVMKSPPCSPRSPMATLNVRNFESESNAQIRSSGKVPQDTLCKKEMERGCGRTIKFQAADGFQGATCEETFGNSRKGGPLARVYTDLRLENWETRPPTPISPINGIRQPSRCQSVSSPQDSELLRRKRLFQKRNVPKIQLCDETSASLSLNPFSPTHPEANTFSIETREFPLSPTHPEVDVGWN